MVEEWKRVLTSYPYTAMFTPSIGNLVLSLLAKVPVNPHCAFQFVAWKWDDLSGGLNGFHATGKEPQVHSWRMAVVFPSSFCLNAPAPFADFFAACTHPGFASVCQFQKCDGKTADV